MYIVSFKQNAFAALYLEIQISYRSPAILLIDCDSEFDEAALMWTQAVHFQQQGVQRWEASKRAALSGMGKELRDDTDN
uniref:PH domain-containing protein n=1 Tax=Heterorhabditis bacteriophora TaxID=37862 RepID=A0A1I7X9S5_HETBA